MEAVEDADAFALFFKLENLTPLSLHVY